MSVPNFYGFLPFVLEVMSDGQVKSRKEIRNELAILMNLTKQDTEELLDSGNESKFQNRSNWSIQYLFKAQFIERPKRAHYVLTDLGKEFIERNGFNVTVDDLYEIESFKEFMKPGSSKPAVNSTDDKENQEINQTPKEQIEEAISLLNDNLKDELLEEVLSMDPFQFERLVLELLVKMGYGGRNLKNIQNTTASNDEGIDGLIKEDALGLDHIYIQAKRWKNTVGRPEIQNFVGALTGHGASKGVFMTTSQFSKQAVLYADRHLATKIVLIDGKELVNLMITYDLGVNIADTYQIKDIDIDYFISDE